jgi:hypothetical protein
MHAPGQVRFHGEWLVRANQGLSLLEVLPGSGDFLGPFLIIASFNRTSWIPILCDRWHVLWHRQGPVLYACGHVNETRLPVHASIILLALAW